MSTQIGILSDIHATPDPLREALDLFEQEQVDEIICVGDISGYGDDLDTTLQILMKTDCHIISGNHDEWLLRAPSREKKNGWIHFLTACQHI